MWKRRIFIPAAAIALAFAACTDAPVAPDVDLEPQFGKNANGRGDAPVDPAAEISNIMDAINASLAAEGADYQVAMAEYITDGESGELGNTVIAKNVGNKQLSHDFVPGDARRAWGDPGGGITYAIDQTGDAVPFAGGLTQPQTDAAIVRATTSWDNEECSNLPLVRNPDFGIDIGFVAYDLSGGGVGSPFIFADVQHAGWRDLEFGGGTIGITFTFLWCDPCGTTPVFTDIDNNGKADTAFGEIYYDPFEGTFGPSRVWADDGVSDFDVETVALHEIGHGLSQAHFGTVPNRIVYRSSGEGC